MVNFEIVDEIAVLGSKKNRSGEACEVKLTRMRWQGSHPMWDPRMWSADGKPMKGLTLTGGMIRELKKALDGLDLKEE